MYLNLSGPAHGSRLRVALLKAGLAISAGILASGCDLRTTAPGPRLTIEADSSSIQADSVSRTRIVAQRADSSSVEIKLRCDVGRFAEASSSTPRELTLKAVDGRVQVTYVAGARPGNATIVVESGTLSERTQIELRPARPTSIFLTSDRTTAKGNGIEAVTLSARLLRPEFGGSVSLGTRVEFVATDGEGREIDSLQGMATLDSLDGTVTHKVVSSAAQAINFTAHVVGSMGQVRSNAVQVMFTPP